MQRIARFQRLIFRSAILSLRKHAVPANIRSCPRLVLRVGGVRPESDSCLQDLPSSHSADVKGWFGKQQAVRQTDRHFFAFIRY
jgi:hypothetical protein